MRSLRFAHANNLAIVSVLLLAICGCKSVGILQPIEITFSHTGASATTIGDVHAASGQKIDVYVTNTNTKCYAFNGKAVVAKQPTANLRQEFLFTETVGPFEAEMRDDPFEITIEARSINSDPACKPGGERIEGGTPGPWKIRVLREGWDIAFAGAYTADTATNPVYGLVAGQKQVDPSPAPKTSGFFIKRFREQEDAYRLGAAAMVHVFHTSPSTFAWHDIAWVPVSFGLGVGEASQVRYFLGTGIRFGPKFFLTAGPVIGSVKTLPAGLVADNADDPAGFTTNANALGSMGSRTRTGFFVGVSYTFAGVGPSSFTGPFTQVHPSGGAGAPTATLNIDVSQKLAQKVMKYRLVVTNTSQTAIPDAALVHKVYDATGVTSQTTCTAEGGGTCPQRSFTGDLNVKFDLKPSAKYTFEVTTTFVNDNPPAQNLTATVLSAQDKLADAKITVPQ